jgi:hypothetical protein
VQLGVDEVDLAQAWLARIAGHARAMLHGLARMRVAFDAQPGDEPDAALVWLAEGVRRASADRRDSPTRNSLLGTRNSSRVLKRVGCCGCSWNRQGANGPAGGRRAG